MCSSAERGERCTFFSVAVISSWLVGRGASFVHYFSTQYTLLIYG
jgi:hypothetical protein